MQNDVREAQKTLGELKAKLAAADAQSYVDQARTIGDLRVVASIVPDADAASLRALAGAIRSSLPHGVIALVGTNGDGASIFVSASDDAVKAGVHAGNLVKAAVPELGGKGGGAPAQAQGGGKNVAGAAAALASVVTALSAVPV
jgi:alanyl-tRNA synthetase